MVKGTMEAIHLLREGQEAEKELEMLRKLLGPTPDVPHQSLTAGFHSFILILSNCDSLTEARLATHFPKVPPLNATLETKI